jgi:glucose-1-phosphate adenylyltransferase
VEGAEIRGSVVADGCRIKSEAVIENSVIGLRCIIGNNVTIRNSILMGADAYETNGDEAVPIGVGDGSVIENCIIDKNCRIGRNVVIRNEANLENSDREGCLIRDGIPVVEKGATLPDGWKL